MTYGVTRPPALSEFTVEAERTAITLHQSSGTGATSAVEVVWVPHCPGNINYAATDTNDVLSGMFTGCVMSTYTAGGERRVAHVHTGDDAGEGTDCKDTMQQLLAGAYTSVANFKPFDRRTGTDETLYMEIAMASGRGANGCMVMGLVTTANRCFSLFLQPLTTASFMLVRKIERRHDSFQY